MSEVTRILSALEEGDPHAAEELLPLIYNELRHLAAQKMAQEKPGQTLQATALVHEAYLRLVGPGGLHWDNRGHFFCAAAEAMRRILIENARRKRALKHGGDRHRIPLDAIELGNESHDVDLLALDEALNELERHAPQMAQLVKLRYFSGLGHQESAQVLGVSRRVADRLWATARAWLYDRLGET
jgi:RNA polymerase sigma factor (TIGR02999 family)